MKKKTILIILILCSVLAVSLYYYMDTQTAKNAQANQIMGDHLQAAAFQKAIQTGNYMLLDIRTIEEYNEGHLKGAIQIDYYQTEAFTKYIGLLDKTKSYLIYCRSGNRSGKALKQMRALGLTVVDLDGGYKAWTAANLPTEK